MTGPGVLDSLQKVGLFSSLEPADLRQVVSLMNVMDFRKGETVLREEQTNAFMYIILDGEAKVSRATRGGREVILAMHRSGDFFGEMSLLDGRTAPARVSATCDSTIAVISKSDFSSMLFSQKGLVEKLLQIMCLRLREAHAMIEMLNFSGASQRVRMLLLIIAEKHGEKAGDGVRLRVRLTHQDIANMTGMSRETVTRVLDKWRDDGDLSVVNRSMLLSGRFCRDITCSL